MAFLSSAAELRQEVDVSFIPLILQGTHFA